MRAYELMVILDPDLEERTVQPSLDTYLNVVRKDGGSVENIDIWGRRRLAYEIDHKADGVYHLIHITCPPDALDEISRVLKIDDGVMRHLATRRIEGSRIGARPPEPVAVGAGTSDDAGEIESVPAEEE